ncbi:MAG: nucleotidyltransferase domain-containing protein [Cyanobacteriota bacterium]
MFEKQIETLTKELKEKHKPHTIILYGSYADNTFNENSDIDIICIKKDGEHYKDARLWNDIFLDVWIYPEDKLQNLDEFIHIAIGKVLYQEDTFGNDFINKLKTALLKPIEEFTKNEEDFSYIWSKKMIRRSKVDDIEGNYRKNWLINDLLSMYYFQVRKIRPMGIKKNLIYLKNNDFPMYQLFNEVYSNTYDFDKIDLLIDKVFLK